MNPLHRARTPRGKCDTCREPIEPGQMYRTATRYQTHRDPWDVKTVNGGQVPIVLHEECPYTPDSAPEARPWKPCR